MSPGGRRAWISCSSWRSASRSWHNALMTHADLKPGSSDSKRSCARTRATVPDRPPPIRPVSRRKRRAEARAKAKELLGSGERSAGAQPGHRGAGLKLAPEDQVDEIVEHYPDSCRRCGHGFGSSERRPSSRFGRHQVAELPPIAVRLTEHRTHRLQRQLPRQTTAELPAGLGTRPSGSRAQAAADDERPQPHLAPRHGRARE